MPMGEIEEISESIELSEFKTDRNQILKEEITKQIEGNPFLKDFVPGD